MSIEPRPSDTPTQARRPHHASIWSTRRDFTGCYVRVSRVNDDLIDVYFPDGLGSHRGWCMPISRGEARLLARRLNECLDATVKR